ncbi:DUF4795 domain-containing protein [Bacteroides thetaiotaomicron]|nr:DUF4795 domain-containing protein [Bacteroides thetaiotaomicron]
MTRLAKAITLVTVTGLIEQYQNEYIINEAKVNELEGKIQTVKNEITAYKDEINRVNTIKKDSELVNLTEQEKADIYKKVLSRVVYYSEDYFRGFIVISYKNGLENIVAINKTVFGYISPLPSSFGFNVDKRTITVQVSKKQPSLKSFSSGDIETREYNFKEMESNFDLKQWNITK